MRYLAALLGVLMFVVPGCILLPGPAEDTTRLRFAAEADAATVLVLAADPVLESDAPRPTPPSPAPKPGAVCPSCDGSGRTGDGQGTCGDCDGTGKVPRATSSSGPLLGIHPAPEQVVARVPVPEQVEAPVKKQEIILHVSQVPRDHWTVRWWKEVRPVLLDRDVNVSFVKESSGSPWLAVCGTRCARVDGEPTLSQLLEILEEVK